MSVLLDSSMGADYQLKHRKTREGKKIGEMLLSRLTHLHMCGVCLTLPAVYLNCLGMYELRLFCCI